MASSVSPFISVPSLSQLNKIRQSRAHFGAKRAEIDCFGFPAAISARLAPENFTQALCPSQEMVSPGRNCTIAKSAQLFALLASSALLAASRCGIAGQCWTSRFQLAVWLFRCKHGVLQCFCMSTQFSSNCMLLRVKAILAKRAAPARIIGKCSAAYPKNMCQKDIGRN